jgi:starch phosphorylase
MSEQPRFLTAFDLGMDQPAIKQSIANHVEYTRVKDEYTVTALDLFWAVARVARDRMVDRWNKTQQGYHRQRRKRVYYLSLEFLLGRLLQDSLLNLGILEPTRQAVADLGFDLDTLLEAEPDAGLGNGGLGRLAACFLDSMATLGIAGTGYGIRYEYGIFRQEIVGGGQLERADNWLRYGNPWEVERPDILFKVQFGGRVNRYTGAGGRVCCQWLDADVVMAMAHDLLVPGYRNGVVNTLRLWGAKASREFSFAEFNRGDYIQSIQDKNASENISRVLYPNDMVLVGRELRLKQEYFFVSATLQDALRRHLTGFPTLANLHELAVFQLNDTHPAIAVAELMRLLVDEHGFDWEAAWHITRRCFAYTNHTVMPEALEEWEVSLMERLLPRHMQIIYDINWSFLMNLRNSGADDGRLQRTSIIAEGGEKRVRMANLAVIGSFAVNGVSELHAEIVKTGLFPDFAALEPNKFTAKTNGITPRRWLLECNSALSELITESIGDAWVRELGELERIAPLAEDAAFRQRWRAVKYANKLRLRERLGQLYAIEINPEHLIDAHVKRIHEYKRQLLNLLHVIALYLEYRRHPPPDVVPRTFIFGGKAAPGYVMAKRTIELINAVSDTVNRDPATRGLLRVVFAPDYRVSLAEVIIPASDVSEQISTAGTEASGTSNMKFALNGAITVGTLDGANIEIMQAVGESNVFSFGLSIGDVKALYRQGYEPNVLYESDPELKSVIDAIEHGTFAPIERGKFAPIAEYLRYSDPYLVLADFKSYRMCQKAVSTAFNDVENWTRRSILNTANMGRFSSDRTIREYAREIWGVPADGGAREADR